MKLDSRSSCESGGQNLHYALGVRFRDSFPRSARPSAPAECSVRACRIAGGSGVTGMSERAFGLPAACR